MDGVFPKLYVFPVLTCNQKCSYCINRYGDYSGTMPTLLQHKVEPASRWVAAIRSLRGLQSLNVNGGEPGLHPEIADIVNGVPDNIQVALGTNATRAVLSRLLEIDRRENVWIQATFHPTQISVEEFARCVGELLAKFRGGLGFHTVGPTRPEDAEYFQKTLGQAPSWHELAADETGRLGVDHPCVRPKSPPLAAVCPIPYWAEVAPNGDLYACHALMYAQSRIGVLGNLFEGWTVRTTEMECPKYGHCNPCDVERFRDPIAPLAQYLANPRPIR